LPHLFIHLIVTCASYFVDFLQDDALPTPGAGVQAAASGATYRAWGGTLKHLCFLVLDVSVYYARKK
jgi:hypothetical protein